MVYTEELLSKKERKKKERKKKKKTVKWKRAPYVPPLHGLYMKQFYIQFHPFYITNRINNTINGIFCHRLQYEKGTYGTIAYILEKTMQLIHICYVNITIHYTSNYWSRVKLHVHPQFKQTSTWSSFSLSLRIDVMSLQRIHFRRLNSELLVSCKHDNYETDLSHITQTVHGNYVCCYSIQFIALSNKE